MKRLVEFAHRHQLHKEKPPQVQLIKTNYLTGVRLTKPEMKEIESQILRLPNLPNWFVDIFPASE